jgi:hypothetical protein
VVDEKSTLFMRRPIILFVFANPSLHGGRHLPFLNSELGQLEELNKQGKIDFRICENATWSRLLETFAAFDNSEKQCVRGIHFGGHASENKRHTFLELAAEYSNGTSIEDPDYVIGAAVREVFSVLPHLDFVFLNGCSTSRLCKDIATIKGVPVTIGTKEDIDDKLAYLFSIAFYQTLLAIQGSRKKLRTSDFIDKVKKIALNSQELMGRYSDHWPYEGFHSPLVSPNVPMWPFPWDCSNDTKSRGITINNKGNRKTIIIKW